MLSTMGKETEAIPALRTTIQLLEQQNKNTAEQLDVTNEKYQNAKQLAADLQSDLNARELKCAELQRRLQQLTDINLQQAKSSETSGQMLASKDAELAQ